MQKQGKLVIFSAPSGSGKTTIVKHLVAQIPELGYSISACTRPRRGRTEEHGKDYYFLSKEEFEQKIRNDEFVEWEQVYSGAYYGTLKSEIQRIWNSNKHVIFDVDVVGGLRIKEYYGDSALAIFVKVSSVEELRKRLLQRQTETDASLETRLAKAEYEMSFEDRFDVVLLNENLEETLQKAIEIVQVFLGNNTKQ
ncbi:MAG: guanylate kinase [Raineya sp.]